MNMDKPEFSSAFFCNQILDLTTGQMIWPEDYDILPLRYPDELSSFSVRKVQTPRINPLRRQLDIINSDIFDFTFLFQQGYTLDSADKEPIFLTPDQFLDFSYHRDVRNRTFRFFEYVENVLCAEEVWSYYSEKWTDAVLECWFRKHGIELLPNPIKESKEYIDSEIAWKQAMKEKHPTINMDYQFYIRQNEVNSFLDVFI